MKGEFELISDIRSMFPTPEGFVGIGDDCAVIPGKDGEEILVSTDMLVDGSHFLLDDITPYQLGWKSAASNFSDIAAMGGRPVGSFLALALPASLPDGWRTGFLEGYKAISQQYAFPLLGGDTTAADRLCICITVLGSAPAGRSLKRSGAQPGDLICVSGNLGDAAAGLDAILKRRQRTGIVQELVSRHYLPKPRIDEGIALARSGLVHSMMDISDGIASDVRHIMEESGVGAEIDLTGLPVSDRLRSYCDVFGLDINGFAAAGGEDYELLFTVPPQARGDIPVPYTVIGSITAGRDLVWKGSDKDYQGFRHF